jgi:flavin reductase (DIM6/NTAB) family NADH-FMN oxidoreductase RutF
VRDIMDMVALFRQLTLGVYIVGVAHHSRRDAFTASALMQASYNPLILALAINPGHVSYPLLRAGQTFAVSVLEQTQMPLARRFGTSTPETADKMEGVAWRYGCRGAPILQDGLAFFECALCADIPAGDHRLVLGRVIDGAKLWPAGVPLAYADTHNLDRSAELYPASF